MTQQGYLIIADIAGYTAFLTQAELDHAQAVIEDLLNTLLAQIHPPLIFSKVEGDAIFMYAPQGSFRQGQTLLETVENLYCVFAAARESMHRNTSCDCRACRLLPTLDLKFVVHYGVFSLTEMGGQQELTGPEVMLVRHLFKRPIARKSGLKAYALLTTAAIEAMKLDELSRTLPPFVEHHPDFGQIKGFIHDLHPVWAQRA